METVWLIIIVIAVVLGSVAVSMARGFGGKFTRDHSDALVERAKTKAEIEQHQQDMKAREMELARQRAVALSDMRNENRMKIMEADSKNLQLLEVKLHDAGALKVEFEDGSDPERKGVPAIRWSWKPIGNAIIRIYRNEGTILEEVEAIKQKATLIHVVQDEAAGEYRDKEAAPGRTYNYYAFIEAKRMAIKPKSVTRELPPELAGVRVIDASGEIVSKFQDVEPEEIQEAVYSGLRYRRMTIEIYKTERDHRRAALDERSAEIDLKRYEAELSRLEEEIHFESGDIGEDDLDAALAQARKQTDGKRKIEEFLERIREDDSIDEEDKEIIEQRLMAKLLR